MKTSILSYWLIVITLYSCTKALPVAQPAVAPSTATVTKPASTFVQYHINKGEQSCENNLLKNVQYDQLTFVVRFDSSAIYTTQLAENQHDINKLFGFSDNNAPHHEYSARIGWRWSENALHLFGYIYNAGQRQSQEITTINLGKNVECHITVSATNYIFSVDGKQITMPRLATTTHAIGYKLYPYFGGDESAPHDINIWIEELPG